MSGKEKVCGRIWAPRRLFLFPAVTTLTGHRGGVGPGKET